MSRAPLPSFLKFFGAMSKVKLASWSTLRKAVTKDPRTYNFDHLLPVERPQHIGKEQGSWAKNIPLPKDRIKQWNIVPGDEIRVLNKWVDSRTVFEVAEINRFRNVLYAPVKVCLIPCLTNSTEVPAASTRGTRGPEQIWKREP